MAARDTFDLAEQLVAAQSWWREAGVDLAYADEATDWLAKQRPKAEESPPRPGPQAAAELEHARVLRLGGDSPPSPRIGGDRAHWPTTLADFAGWWLTEPSLDPAPAAQRVVPAGPANATLMVLVAMPEPGDSAALLGGRQGQLLDAILAAFGHRRDDIYLASVLSRPVAAPDWPALVAARLGEVLAHHIALAAPRRLIVFGKDVSPLLGHDPAQVAQSSPRFNHEGLSVPLMLAPALEALLGRPALKRGLWTRWLDWGLE